MPTAESQRVARDTLRDLLDRSRNAVLSAAAAEASLGPLARAYRIVNSGREALAARPDVANADPKSVKAWRLRLEAVAREIDASFVPEVLPKELADVRAEIVCAIKATDSIKEAAS